jgi:hypothetical protein
MRKMIAIGSALVMVLMGLVAIAPCGVSETYTLWAGQYIDAGTITVTNDAENIYLTYATINGWEITSTHYYVGLTDPNNQEDALSSAPGQFPYQDVLTSPTDSVTYIIPIGDLDYYSTPKGAKWEAAGTPGDAELGDTIYIATHAEAQKEEEDGTIVTESAWCEGDEFGKGWAMFATYELKQVLELQNKDTSTWDPILIDDTYGILKFDADGPEFVYEFDGYGLLTGTSYSLIYYCDPYPGNGYEHTSGALIANGVSDGSGYVHFEGSIDLGMDLPDPTDQNYEAPTTYGETTGAKIWLVPSSVYNPSTNALTWSGAQNFLFEMNLIHYDDTDA